MIARRAVLALVLSLAALPALADKLKVFSTNGVAINGYDPVAYFTAGQPVRGKAAHAVRWKGATWLFSSAENLAAFEADPHRYAPQYGGYCALALAEGQVVSTVPEAWTIYKGKLYLNYSEAARAHWKQDIPGFVKKTDANWPALSGR